MKILKPGKVEQRKFTCPHCGCVFVATLKDVEERVYVRCPHEACHYGGLEWNNGEPYEEPTPTKTDRERLKELLMCSDEYYTSDEFTDYLIAHGVTFRKD